MRILCTSQDHLPPGPGIQLIGEWWLMWVSLIFWSIMESYFDTRAFRCQLTVLWIRCDYFLLTFIEVDYILCIFIVLYVAGNRIYQHNPLTSVHNNYLLPGYYLNMHRFALCMHRYVYNHCILTCHATTTQYIHIWSKELRCHYLIWRCLSRSNLEWSNIVLYDNNFVTFREKLVHLSDCICEYLRKWCLSSEKDGMKSLKSHFT